MGDHVGRLLLGSTRGYGPGGTGSDPRNGILNENYKTKDQGSTGSAEELCLCVSC
jgi:hypothetical protein